jgi:hypothetical protein
MPATLRRRLADTVAHTTGRPTTEADIPAGVTATEPDSIRAALAPLLPSRFTVTGTIERRLVAAERPDGQWTVADLAGQPHGTRDWPAWTLGHLTVDTPATWLSTASVTEAGALRLVRPRILFAALYHPENFPLPRFCLAISDLARAARATLSGQVQLMDMQLGVSADDILDAVTTGDIDVVGLSATFGQHDIMDDLLHRLYALHTPPLVVAGGSLTARNEVTLLHRYPDLLVARGAGEPTVSDLIAHLHGDLRRDEIRGVGYVGAPRGGGLGVGLRRTGGITNRAQTDIFPELDLLDATFAHGGVAQLETSRGCTSTCSFCPRGHKGKWSGAAPDALPVILAGMRTVFDRYPDVSQTVYLVDEEFIGRGPDAVDRALAVAKTVHREGFQFESSCRIDQVVHPGHDRAWHIERAAMWRDLLANGLRRMLFGVESGVTTILDRFHKETTGEQNALAIRTLSALGVPTRFTYITFDQLMTAGELTQTLDFQGRTDLLLRPLPHLPVEEIVDGVHDPAFVAAHSTGRPFFTGISYMAVSMECLTSAPYTRLVQQAGLTGDADPSMGRISSRFADWRIGRCSHFAQLWVDRNFALDYLLKSLEKLLDDEPRRAVRQVRVVIKAGAYALLRQLLDLFDDFDPALADQFGFDQRAQVLLDTERAALAVTLDAAVTASAAVLPTQHADRLRKQHRQWQASTGWQLINGAGPCTT